MPPLGCYAEGNVMSKTKNVLKVALFHLDVYIVQYEGK